MAAGTFKNGVMRLAWYTYMYEIDIGVDIGG